MEFWVVFFPPSPSNCKIFQLKIDSQITQTCCYFSKHWRTNGKIQKIMLAASKKMFEFNTNLFRVSLFFLPLCWQIRGNFRLLTKGNRCGRFALPICQFFAKNISLLQQISKFCSKDECLCAKWGWILLDLRTIYILRAILRQEIYPFFA